MDLDKEFEIKNLETVIILQSQLIKDLKAELSAALNTIDNIYSSCEQTTNQVRRQFRLE